MFHWGYTFDYGLANANPSAARASKTHVGRPLISGWGWVLGAMRQLLGTGENEDGSIIGADFVRDSASKQTLHINNTLGAFRTANPKHHCGVPNVPTRGVPHNADEERFRAIPPPRILITSNNSKYWHGILKKVTISQCLNYMQHLLVSQRVYR